MDFLKKVNKTVVLGCLAAVFALVFIYFICSIINSSFNFGVVITLVITGLIVLALALNKENLFKYSVAVYGSYLFITALYSTQTYFSNTIHSNGAIDVIYFLFITLAYLLFSVSGVLYSIKYLKKANNINLINILLLIAVVCFLLVVIFTIIMVAQSTLPWTYIILNLCNCSIFISLLVTANYLENK